MRWVVLLLAAVSAAGCFKAQAKTPTPPVALVTPAPPDRIIVAVPVPEPVEAVAPAPAAAGPVTPPRTQPTRPATERPAPTAPPAAAPPAVVTEAPAPPPVLLQTSNPEEVAQRARDLIVAATRDLAQINPSNLSANARAQYDSARGFVKQAESALNVMKNVVLARELADKAASLAAQLRR